jgi:hypothetical protein
MTATITTNGRTHNHVPARGARRASARLDYDVTYFLVHRLDRIVRRLSPATRIALAEGAMLHRARVAFRLARCQEMPEDRLLQTLWRKDRAAVVHWAVGATSAAAGTLYETREFLGCGRKVAGVECRDSRWRRGTETTRPITCPHCLALLQQAQG